ncbi:DUF86 domain-containing protein [Paenibacillus doosanensis]|uniref:DUF86 domain-containing protein n=1 Tax=Paenibacillus konkukensis TaxID=2020716 RepID=A0ABY4RN87_9BACL|nr:MULTISPECIES: HepT-like ribonuclease domain-containing protein [Paenibacillus]MCS7462217.1 DUF86 domain-containing protein [Paenibacillus doosanensis]UQZ82919.1 hypothetical protein SK3146_02079 [Paenibacillus konkukensis]
MYYVNHEQINVRLQFLPVLSEACGQLVAQWDQAEPSARLLLHLAQERTLHLAIESVTDVGSLLIDAFMMRDASSYEDIIDILAGEGVFDGQVSSILKQLVALRKPLVQDYAAYPREALHPLILALPEALSAFAEAVPAFISREMV